MNPFGVVTDVDRVNTIITGLFLVLGSAITVGLPLWWSSRRGRRKLLEQVGTPKENGSIAGDLQMFKGEVRERFRAGDVRFDRLDRGHDELRDGQVEMTNAIAQVTGVVSELVEKVDELNELHKQPNLGES